MSDVPNPPPDRAEDWRTVRLETRIPGFRVIASKTGYYPVCVAKP